MKICISGRQPVEYLNKADEFKFEFRDRRGISSISREYPDKTMILEHKVYDDAIDWEEIRNINIMCKKNFIFCVDDTVDCAKAKELNIKFYHSHPVTDPYQLYAFIELGVSYVIIGAPLFFEMDLIKKIVDKSKTEIRLFPNCADIDRLPREDRICGPWIRPEDLEMYDKYLGAVEFSHNVYTEVNWLPKEQALFRIYFEDKTWPGQLNYIIEGLNVGDSIYNRLIMSDYMANRMNCGQRCLRGSSCKVCYRSINLADLNAAREYKNAIDNKENS